MGLECAWIFTDDRLPGVKLVCYGRCTMNVWVEGDFDHFYQEAGWSNTDCFTMEHDDQYKVTFDAAREAAEEWFTEELKCIHGEQVAC
jgi:hypothetical protein